MEATNPRWPSAEPGAPTTSHVGHGPISPELALVDPQLAAWARARLPDIPSARLVLLGSPASGSETEPRPVPHEPVGTSRARLILMLATALAATFGVGFISRGLIITPNDAGEAKLTAIAPPDEQQSPAAAEPATMTPPTPVATPRRSKPPRVSRKSTGRAPRQALATPGASVPAKAPELIWARNPGSDAYRVGLFRSSRRVFTTVTRQPRVRIPLRWRHAGTSYVLRSGPYRWVVWPLVREGGGYRERAAIVNASIRF